jgi:YVTN family beta-propeller protein
MPRSPVRTALLALVLLLAGPAAGPAAAVFVTFESGHVRPLALSPDGTRLFAVNTPDDRLEIFAVDGTGALTHAGSVPVGMEPVAVAARTDGEVWVVNHLSDSVSIVDVASSPLRVTRTLLVGDEPRDIVFAGPGGNRAFVTTAHRGQNSGVPLADLTTEGIGRADVWVFDALALGATLGGTPLTILELFGDTPRALAVSPDGNTVYAAVFHSGNRTTTVSEGAVCDGGAGAGSCSVFGFSMPGGLPLPSPSNCAGEPQPETGLIVKFDPAAGEWRDPLARNWNNAVRFSLPDYDVFAIDAAAGVPAPTGMPWPGVGTILFNMAVNPVSGRVYVSNTEARNEVRFEGPGGCSTTVRGHLHEARVTVLDGATVTPRHLNRHISYALADGSAFKPNSLATPLGMAVTPDGATLYVAAFGSSKVGVFDTAQLENDTFTPNGGNYIPVSGGGPSGVLVRGSRLYVSTRFDNAISVVDTGTKAELQHLPVYSPEPTSVKIGRPILYDAVATSSNGEAACAACHVFADFDSLAWDLGNPDDTTLNNPNPIEFNFGQDPDFRPLKGPMTTQSLRGMANHGPMHWRGDRTGGNDPGGSALDEDAAFKKFIVAFDGLLGLGGSITNAQMQAFTDFILQVTYPPNPVRALDNSLTADQAGGTYFGRLRHGAQRNGCHRLTRGRLLRH